MVFPIDLSKNADVEAAIHRAKDLLRCGEKIQLRLKFRGREMASREFGYERIQSALESLSSLGEPAAAPKLIGKCLFVIVTPIAKRYASN
jgi:translation initiation factor IF-3